MVFPFFSKTSTLLKYSPYSIFRILFSKDFTPTHLLKATKKQDKWQCGQYENMVSGDSRWRTTLPLNFLRFVVDKKARNRKKNSTIHRQNHVFFYLARFLNIHWLIWNQTLHRISIFIFLFLKKSSYLLIHCLYSRICFRSQNSTSNLFHIDVQIIQGSRATWEIYC